jgi:hypothetical protein
MRWRGHARDFSAPLKGRVGREWDPLWERFRGLYRSLGRWSGNEVVEASKRGFGTEFPSIFPASLERPVPFACAVALAIILPLSKPPSERVNTITIQDTLRRASTLSDLA